MPAISINSSVEYKMRYVFLINNFNERWLELDK